MNKSSMMGLVLGVLGIAACSQGPGDEPAKSPESDAIAIDTKGVHLARPDGAHAFRLEDAAGVTVGRVDSSRHDGEDTLVVAIGKETTTFHWDATSFSADKGAASLRGHRGADRWYADDASGRSTIDGEIAILLALAPPLHLALPGGAIEAPSTTTPQMDFGQHCYTSYGYNTGSCSGACNNACLRPGNPVNCDLDHDSSCITYWFWYSCTVTKCYDSAQPLMDESAF